MNSFNNLPMITSFNPADTPKGTKKNYWMRIISDGFANPICIPVMVARGMEDGPVLGLTAAIHGNELNGIPVIQRLFYDLDINELRGTIVGVPVVNVPGFMMKTRRFNDNVDLNHIMPGKEHGNVSEVYAFRLIEKLVRHIDYLLDLHTASFGRVNSYYVRADMEKPEVKELAELQNADIIVHNPPYDGTLRGAVDALGIPAITLEVGNPNTFQRRLIKSGIEGIHNVLCHLNMISDEIIPSAVETVVCQQSIWIYTDTGGLLSIEVELREKLKKDQKIAILRDIFGKKIREFNCPHDGIVIGKSISPVNESGGRIIHLGLL